MRKLDIGCGRHKQAGFEGMDLFPLPGVDIMWDLEKTPWPIEDDAYDEVIAYHSLQQVREVIPAVCEIHRITKPGGLIRIRVPHAVSWNMWSDPMQKTFFGLRWFDCFDIQSTSEYTYYIPVQFEIVKKELRFVGPGRFDPFRICGIAWLANRCSRFFERFAAFMLPPTEVYFELRKVSAYRVGSRSGVNAKAGPPV